MAQASLAPCRQADIFHNRKRRRAPWSISTSSPMPFGREVDVYKAWAIPCITCRARSCNCERSCNKSPIDAGISSSGRPVNIPTDISSFQYASSSSCTTVRLGTCHKCRDEAFCSPSRSPPAEREHLLIRRPAEHWHLEDCSSPT